ncbi:hypothetical protein I552_7812 [Mycobacterium xenopi 3993]|nr:hypothetical protein I552_7812 [Mycobacterium xenopi 3993]
MNLARRRGLGADDVAGQRGEVCIFGGVGIDVLGHGQVNRGRTFRLGHLERFADHFRNRPRGGNAVGPAGDRSEHRHQVDVLVRLLVLTVAADLGGDRDQRGAVGGGIGDAELHVDRTRPNVLDTTAARPVTRPYISAMNAAPCSWRVST